MQYEREYSKRAHIIRFRDGDTLVAFIKCEHCQAVTEEIIRLSNIESWEPIGADSARAKSIATALTETYRGRIGILIPNKERRDRYGRLIADLMIDGELLSNLIVKSGRAWYGVGEPEPNHS